MDKKVHYCSICGVSSETKGVHKNKIYGDYLCEKHKQQLKTYGKFLDSSPRGVFDPNEVRDFDTYSEVDTYDSKGNVVATYKISKEDKEKLGDYKWRTVFKNNKPYMFTGNQSSKRIYFHRLVLPVDNQVDHISGDTTDNRRENLREATIQENMLNLQKKSNNTSGVRGVSYHKTRNEWKVDFTYKKQRFYLKGMETFEEAVYLRYLCETTYLKDRRNTANDELILSTINKLSKDKKKEVLDYFNERINTMKIGV